MLLLMIRQKRYHINGIWDYPFLFLITKNNFPLFLTYSSLVGHLVNSVMGRS